MADTSRFERTFKLIIEVDGKVIEILPPLKLVFNAYKSVFGGLNKMSMQIFNLKEDTRLRLVKDKEQVKIIKYSFETGYVGMGENKGKTELIFRGTVQEGSNSREGPDIITTLETLDGGTDFLNSYTNMTVKPGAKPIEEIINKDMPNTEIGKIDKKDNLTRPKVLVGNSVDLIEKSLNPGETWYIENEKFYIIKDEDTTSKFIPIVSAVTGLLSTPTRKDKVVTFSSLMNPSIKIGERIKLVSKTAPHLDGIYRVDTINYAGDNYGQEWDQIVSARLFSGKII